MIRYILMKNTSLLRTMEPIKDSSFSVPTCNSITLFWVLGPLCKIGKAFPFSDLALSTVPQRSVSKNLC
ncbi:hypothetical protein VTO42DRAFT_604 [Malbranchea cinnamomea]